MKYLIVGLGNIGEEYHHTKHNIGFDVVDCLIQKIGGEWATVKHGKMATISHKGKKLLVLKPNTFMNISGKAVAYWMQLEKIALENIFIITDDLSLPLAILRIKTKGSDGGHNGLKSIQMSLNTENYARLRFGIGSDFEPGRQVEYVLGKWKEEEKQSVLGACDRCVEGILQYCLRGIGFAMNYTNTPLNTPTKTNPTHPEE
ncbi:MAG: aminoacyl-tRNA hydrolase [Flavobacteriaceae bacterium]|nr:aminoacyl-tRNA hydrolase [Flavobacteriaceae bacterium]